MSPRLRLLAALPLLLLPLSACGSDDGDRAADPASDTPSGTPSTTGTPTGSPSATDTPSSTGKYPEFEAADYVYRLRVLCFCPQVGTVEVTVADGAVTDAVIAGGPRKGQAAPEFTRLTINEVIAKANDPAAAKVQVEWPDGQDHPTSVQIDRIANAVDDEVTYAIKDVRVTP